MTENSPDSDPEAAVQVSADREQEDTVLDIAIVLAKRKRLVFGLPLLVAFIVAAGLLLQPNIYTATARILPPQQQSPNAAALLAQLGGFAALAGGTLGLKNPSDLYVAMLRSQSITDRLIERFDLQSLYEEDTMVDTRRKLEAVTAITAQDSIITISVDDEDPDRAAKIANAYIEELDRLTQSLAVTEAAQRRLFFERQLRATKDDLAKAEIELRKTQESSGLIQLEEQARAIIASIAEIKARVIAKEAEMAAMRTFASPQNPDYKRAAEQLAGLRSELNALQRKHNIALDGNVILPTGNIPAAGLEYLRRVREVKYQESLFELLAKQYELAKIEEAKDAAIVQVIDRASAPDKKSAPKRALITVLSWVAASIVSLLIAFICEAKQRAEGHPVRAAKLHALRRHLGISRR